VGMHARDIRYIENAAWNAKVRECDDRYKDKLVDGQGKVRQRRGSTPSCCTLATVYITRITRGERKMRACIRIMRRDLVSALQASNTVRISKEARAIPQRPQDDQGSSAGGRCRGYLLLLSPDRAMALAGVDVVVVDHCAMVTPRGVIDRVRWVEENYPIFRWLAAISLPRLRPNRRWLKAALSAVHGGYWPGFNLTPRASSPVLRRAQISAVADVAAALKPWNRAGQSPMAG